MRLVFVLCAAFALGAAAGPVEELKDAPQPAALVAGTLEKVETMPVVEEEEEGKMAGDVGRNRSLCQNAWTQYGSRCFIVIPTLMSWINAEKYCVRNGANLASIHYVIENIFIQDLVRVATGGFPITWIGGTDAVRDGTWLWSDGSEHNFNLWATGQPDNDNRNERCININSSVDLSWNDLACETLLPSVCGTRP